MGSVPLFVLLLIVGTLGHNNGFGERGKPGDRWQRRHAPRREQRPESFGYPGAFPLKRHSRANNEALLEDISAFCRRHGFAESTFGRRAVNDGKFVSRLRFGGHVTTHTVERVRAFMSRESSGKANGSGTRHADRPGSINIATVAARSFAPPQTAAAASPAAPLAPQRAAAASPPSEGNADTPADTHFRFYDNRQKYLLFVNTCTEKQVVAQRIQMELDLIKPHAPAMRLFDAGVGDGTVLTRVMRAMHDRFQTVPFYIVGKEISLEDVRLTLEKMPDRFYEHPATVLVLTNMHYAEAPWLRPRSVAAASGLVWKEVALAGRTAAEFDRQIAQLQRFLETNWTARISPTTGNPLYERPVVLMIYRDDHKLLLESVKPQPGTVRADFDLVIASQPYRARAPLEFKASRVVAPLARALGSGGRLIGIHSHGSDPGLEIIQRVWPGEDPFTMNRHDLLKATRHALGAEARGLSFSAYSDQRSIFRYEMHTLPSEVSSSIGT
ncbi:MAG TPA: hypothetical protein VKT19_05130, partial [Steroidobacteraceae bacterium]|nr:hypothetical protein [Steroidobacteraceae bacterium]